VTAPYLGREGIRLAFQGEANTQIPTMTGVVQSPEIYVIADLTLHLLKSQQLSDLYKQQMETNVLIGDCTVRPDTTPLSPYQIINCSIRTVRELNFSGEDAGFAVSIGGYYLVNSSLFG